MCEGFGCLVVKNAEGEGFTLKFSEPDEDGNCSHSEILSRLGWEDSQDVYGRQFVRVEFANWSAKSFNFDEYGSVPGWAVDSEHDIQSACKKLLNRVRNAYNAHENATSDVRTKYHNAIHNVSEEYDAEVRPITKPFDDQILELRAKMEEELSAAHRKASVVYETFGDGSQERIDALNEYRRTFSDTRHRYETEIANLETERNEACSELLLAAQKKRNDLREEYIRSLSVVDTEMIKKMEVISGYVPAKQQDA
jgi:F0F1-type ATP synthase membrane subunit b/b'